MQFHTPLLFIHVFLLILIQSADSLHSLTNPKQQSWDNKSKAANTTRGTENKNKNLQFTTTQKRTNNQQFIENLQNNQKPEIHRETVTSQHRQYKRITEQSKSQTPPFRRQHKQNQTDTYDGAQRRAVRRTTRTPHDGTTQRDPQH